MKKDDVGKVVPGGPFLILWPILASILSLAGIVGFVLLFVPRMTVWWFILSPLIIIVYQFPAFVVLRMWRRKRARAAAPEAEEGEDEGEESGGKIEEGSEEDDPGSQRPLEG
jgi:phosphotransferase system  glucose/maltose/N-acetylglucosamine-specific IIC component